MVACTFGIVFSLYTFLYLLLLLYRIHRKFTLDFTFVWYNLADVYRTLDAVIGQIHFVVLAILLLLWLHYHGVLGIIERTHYGREAHVMRFDSRLRVALSICGLAFLGVFQLYTTTEFGRFIGQAVLPRSELAAAYDAWFSDSLRVNKTNKFIPVSDTSQRNLFVVQLESLSAELVKPHITPNLIEVSKRYGIFFPKIQSSSVMTVRAQETILCSVLPSLRESLAQSEGAAAGLICLPKILRMHGFRTLYFQSYPDLSFGQIDRFIKNLGFDELHSADIMKPQDTLMPWGYADEVFYQRVFEHLERDHAGEQVFVYIAISSTNHFPFQYEGQKYEGYQNGLYSVPFRRPKNLKQQIANTTFLQDHFFGSMFRKHYLNKFASNSSLFVFGDHSWPIGIHEGNEFNENLAFQENFVSSLAIIPPGLDRKSYSIGKTVTTLYGQIDIVPTILEMYGIKGLNFYGRSLSAEVNIRAKAPKQRCLVSVQPFSGGYVAIIDYPFKHIFDLTGSSVTTYNLSSDPNEMSPVSRRTNDSVSRQKLNSCLSSLSTESDRF
jgi:hypothetical protein